MIKLFLVFILLAGCTETLLEHKSVDDIYAEREVCGQIAEFLKKKKWEYIKENGDWLCVMAKDTEFGPMRQIVFYKHELSPMIRLIRVSRMSD